MENKKRKIVFTNGCFDILHTGHFQLLKECKEETNYVVVGLNSNASVKRMKGENKPINDWEVRKQNLLKTGLVDQVDLFEENWELEKLIVELEPDILVKGSDYKEEEIVGASKLKDWGGELKIVELVDGYSSTRINELRKENFLITGGMGFIGSNLIKFLNNIGIKNITIVEDFDNLINWSNIADLDYARLISIKQLDEEINNSSCLQFYHHIINLGANSNTQEPDLKKLLSQNTELSNNLILSALKANKNINIIHASSAATYGNDYNFTERVTNLKPLNKYGFSKLLTDKVINNLLETKDAKLYSLRFFNVYGEREEFKGNMKSAISKLIEEYKTKNHTFELFKSYLKTFKDGEQKRDFIYVEDVCKVIFHFILKPRTSGIYNVGTGLAVSFNQICKEIHAGYGNSGEPRILYKDMIEPLRSIYQYYTQADITKLRNEGYNQKFLTIKEGIEKIK